MRPHLAKNQRQPYHREDGIDGVIDHELNQNLGSEQVDQTTYETSSAGDESSEATVRGNIS